MKHALRIFILCLSTLLLAGLEVRAENGGPCDADIAKLCNEVPFGDGRITKCLKAHEQELSAACKEHQLAMVKKLKGAPQVCQDDVEQFCREIRPVNRRIIRCLKQHEAQLSTECSSRIRDMN
jgi:Cysteine rich repeat